GADENRGDGCVLEPTIDEALHGFLALAFRLLPERGIEESRGIPVVVANPAIPHDVGPPDVSLVVEAEENTSRHVASSPARPFALAPRGPSRVLHPGPEVLVPVFRDPVVRRVDLRKRSLYSVSRHGPGIERVGSTRVAGPGLVEDVVDED